MRSGEASKECKRRSNARDGGFVMNRGVGGLRVVTARTVDGRICLASSCSWFGGSIWRRR